MTNAEMTDILALTDALLEAGWQVGGENGDFARPLGPSSYPQRHCLIGALRAAVRQGNDFPEDVLPLCDWLSEFLPPAYREVGGGKGASPLILFNDRSRKVTRIRDLVQRAAASLAK